MDPLQLYGSLSSLGAFLKMLDLIMVLHFCMQNLFGMIVTFEKFHRFDLYILHGLVQLKQGILVMLEAVFFL